MAEGDSILRIARRMDAALAGKAVSARTPGRRRPEGLAASSIDGLVLERVVSRGKHLLLHFEDDLTLHSHLGMHGGWHVYGPGQRWRRSPSQAWIALAADDAEAVNFGGSFMRIGRRKRLLRDPRLVRLGPDILAPDFIAAAVIERMRRSDPGAELGEALLDQSLVAGIGNIFKSEGSFEAGIDPNARLESLTDDEIAEVLDATRDLMLEAVESGRQPRRVYRRAGEPCPRCGTRIESRAQGDDARTTYWCPGCQTR
ncbi:MAG TPA: DNA-formamidopyrimidine glycosylase family protein [Solirubrobacterales bacterium]|nr:DNA-formamidopyrimidine glycosylase family protein [Solirubrobacterales bacterium]